MENNISYGDQPSPDRQARQPSTTSHATYGQHTTCPYMAQQTTNQPPTLRGQEGHGLNFPGTNPAPSAPASYQQYGPGFPGMPTMTWPPPILPFPRTAYYQNPILYRDYADTAGAQFPLLHQYYRGVYQIVPQGAPQLWTHAQPNPAPFHETHGNGVSAALPTPLQSQNGADRTSYSTYDQIYAIPSAIRTANEAFTYSPSSSTPSQQPSGQAVLAPPAEPAEPAAPAPVSPETSRFTFRGQGPNQESLADGSWPISFTATQLPAEPAQAEQQARADPSAAVGLPRPQRPGPVRRGGGASGVSGSSERVGSSRSRRRDISSTPPQASRGPTRHLPPARSPLPQPTTPDVLVDRHRASQLLRGAVVTRRVVSQHAVSALESVDIASLDEDQRMCIICYNDYGVANPEGINEAPLRLPKCKHVFGDHCIKKWFSRSDSCPYCRDKLPSQTVARVHSRAIEQFLQSSNHMRDMREDYQGQVQALMLHAGIVVASSPSPPSLSSLPSSPSPSISPSSSPESASAIPGSPFSPPPLNTQGSAASSLPSGPSPAPAPAPALMTRVTNARRRPSETLDDGRRRRRRRQYAERPSPLSLMAATYPSRSELLPVASPSPRQPQPQPRSQYQPNVPFSDSLGGSGSQPAPVCIFPAGQGPASSATSAASATASGRTAALLPHPAVPLASNEGSFGQNAMYSYSAGLMGLHPSTGSGSGPDRFQAPSPLPPLQLGQAYQQQMVHDTLHSHNSSLPHLGQHQLG